MLGTVEHFLTATADGRIFAVCFVKRSDGTTRRMVCRRGVSLGIKNVGMSYDPYERNLLVVYDMQKQGYRMIPLEGIISYTVGGQNYKVRHGR